MQEACVLYMQLDKASTVAGIAKMLEEKKGNGYTLYYNALIQPDASLCSFRGCSTNIL
jgi:hypothetical protein